MCLNLHVNKSTNMITHRYTQTHEKRAGERPQTQMRRICIGSHLCSFVCDVRQKSTCRMNKTATDKYLFLWFIITVQRHRCQRHRLCNGYTWRSSAAKHRHALHAFFSPSFEWLPVCRALKLLNIVIFIIELIEPFVFLLALVESK